MPEDTINAGNYTPITRALREYIERHPTMMHAVGLTDLCDNIDAIHKSLEEQNAKLREKVLNQRKQLAEVQEAIERRNNGVLKRRWQKKMDALKNENEEMRDFNYRVREAIRRHEDLTLWGADYTALPLDADDVPIHVGDVMDWEDGGTFEVEGFGVEGLFYLDDARQLMWTNARTKHHHHAPTVEDVLREMLDVWGELPSNVTNEAIIAEYAAKLRLADDGEEQ